MNPLTPLSDPLAPPLNPLLKVLVVLFGGLSGILGPTPPEVVWFAYMLVILQATEIVFGFAVARILGNGNWKRYLVKAAARLLVFLLIPIAATGITVYIGAWFVLKIVLGACGALVSYRLLSYAVRLQDVSEIDLGPISAILEHIRPYVHGGTGDHTSAPPVQAAPAPQDLTETAQQQYVPVPKL